MDSETAIVLCIIALVGVVAVWREPGSASSIIADLIARLRRRK